MSVPCLCHAWFVKKLVYHHYHHKSGSRISTRHKSGWQTNFFTNQAWHRHGTDLTDNSRRTQKVVEVVVERWWWCIVVVVVVVVLRCGGGGGVCLCLCHACAMPGL